LAVVAGKGKGDAFALSSGLFHGSGFCVAPNLFLTAAHVHREAAAAGAVALARLGPGDTHANLVTDSEVFDDIDLALLQCPDLEAEILPFAFEPLFFLTDVAAFGYPFGLELDPPTSLLRALKGYVVTRRTLTHLKARPPGYEVSFVPPVGLSGAPLIRFGPEGGAVTGMVLTHHTATYRDRTMDLGLVLDMEEILTIESRIIGGSIAERLFRRPKITRPKR